MWNEHYNQTRCCLNFLPERSTHAILYMYIYHSWPYVCKYISVNLALLVLHIIWSNYKGPFPKLLVRANHSNKKQLYTYRTCRNPGFLNQKKYCKFGHVSLILYQFVLFSNRFVQHAMQIESRIRSHWIHSWPWKKPSQRVQVQTLLDDHVIKTQTMKGSPYAAEFKVWKVTGFFFQDSCLRLISDELKHNILDVFSMKLEYAENMMFKWNHDFYFIVLHIAWYSKTHVVLGVQVFYWNLEQFHAIFFWSLRPRSVWKTGRSISQQCRMSWMFGWRPCLQIVSVVFLKTIFNCS